MTSQGRRQAARRTPGRIAALHAQGPRRRLVIAKIEGAGEARRTTVVLARTFEGADARAVAAALREHRAELLIHVIPAAGAVCRTVALPEGMGLGANANQDAVADALALMAEADLPASIPAHRRAGGVLRPGPAGCAALPVLIGWPVASRGQDSDGAGAADAGVRAEAWAPELVALATLGAACGGTPTAVSADRDSGAIAVLACSPAKSIARILRGDASSAGAWAESIASAVNGTRAAAGLAAVQGAALPPGAATGETVHLLDAESASPKNVHGAQPDAAWRNAYGVALGAILAHAAEDAGAAPLLTLQPHARNGSGGGLERTLAWLSVPKRAAAVFAACAGLVLLLPLAASMAREAVLEKRAGGLPALNERLAVADREAAFYDLLRARRWPMTKLLADIAGAAPLGVRLESVDLSPELAATGVSIRGVATSPDLVTTFSKNLSDTRILADVATPTIGADPAGVVFNLQARVQAPLFRAKPANDFAEKTLAQHLYGDAASRIDWSRTETTRADNGATQRRSTRTAGTGGETRTAPAAAAPSPTPTPSAPLPAPPSQIPEPLTDEKIAEMDRDTLTREFAARRQAESRAPDEETRQRLRDENEKLRGRLRGGGQ